MYQLKLIDSSNQVWEIPYETITLTEKLNRGLDGSVNINYLALKRYADNFSTTPDDIITSGLVDWKLYKDSTLLYVGILTYRRIYGGNGRAVSYDIKLADYSMIFDKRRTASLKEYTATDSADIAWDLINTSQTDSSGYGDAGITRGTHPTTQDRQRTFKFANIRNAIIGMSNAKIQNGYDFDFDTSKNFNIYYPTKGSIKPDIILDDLKIISWNSDKSLQGDLTNRVYAINSTENNVYNSSEDTTAMGNWGLMEDVITEGTANATELGYRADEYISKHKQPLNKLSMRVRDTNPDITTYNIGDTLTVKIDEINYNQALRLLERNIMIQRSGSALVTLTFDYE